MDDLDFLIGIRSILQSYSSVLIQGDDMDFVVEMMVELQRRIAEEKKNGVRS